MHTCIKRRLVLDMPRNHFFHLNACLNHQLLGSEVAIHFIFQQSSANYTAFQMKNSTTSISAINPVLWKIWTINMIASQHSHNALLQINTLKKKRSMHSKYCAWYINIGTCWTEITSSSENIKPIALAIIEFHLSEGISKVVSQQKISLNMTRYYKTNLHCK